MVSMQSLSRLVTAAVVFSLVAQWLKAEEPSPADTVSVVQAGELRSMVDTLSSLLRRTYVDADLGIAMAKYAEKRSFTGSYRLPVRPDSLAALLTADLRFVSHDEHVRVRYRPFGVTAKAANDDSTTRARHREAFFRDARWDNYGFDAARVFPGGVGYLEFHEFWDPRYAGRVLNGAMEFMRAANAIIIDVRHNGGGHEGLIPLMLGYLLQQPTFLWTETDRLTGETNQTWSVAYVPDGPIDESVPVYILTSARTFSAAEALAYALQAAHRAIVVGERTRGGGNFGDFFRINSRFDIFIPYGRTISAFTHKSLEGTGVSPDVPVPADSALIVARTMALRRIRQTLRDAEWITDVDEALKTLSSSKPRQ